MQRSQYIIIVQETKLRRSCCFGAVCDGGIGHCFRHLKQRLKLLVKYGRRDLVWIVSVNVSDNWMPQLGQVDKKYTT